MGAGLPSRWEHWEEWLAPPPTGPWTTGQRRPETIGPGLAGTAVGGGYGVLFRPAARDGAGTQPADEHNPAAAVSDTPTDGGSSPVCPICLDPIQNGCFDDMGGGDGAQQRGDVGLGTVGLVAGALRCGHVFHVRCAMGWFASQPKHAPPTCPCCRQPAGQPDGLALVGQVGQTGHAAAASVAPPPPGHGGP